MDIATVLGLGGGLALVFITFVLSGGIMMFLDLTSVIIVLGGTFFATTIRWPLNVILGVMPITMKTIMANATDPKEIINEIIEAATTARKGSILALEKVTISNEFLAKAVRYMVDGYDPDVLNSMLEVEIDNMDQRHKDGRLMFEHMAESAPGWGMIGTVIGLIVIMSDLSNPDAIGPGLSVALITTLYGATFANLFFIPLASKLKFRASEELLNMYIIQEGVNSILKGENPNIIKQKLNGYLAPVARELEG